MSHVVAGGGDKIDFVVCKFGCSESLKGKVADDYGDRESVVRSRFVVDEDFCLTFDDKHGASMYPLLANPVLLDSQVAQPKAMAQQMVVCRGGRCAAGAKAKRASLAKEFNVASIHCVPCAGGVLVCVCLRCVCATVWVCSGGARVEGRDLRAL